ncbi:MAG: hypothetical protein JWN98_2617 [Abditibacteriota bacterium]|nr:hypothetical protein [Abditibacteriota bacterium]
MGYSNWKLDRKIGGRESDSEGLACELLQMEHLQSNKPLSSIYVVIPTCNEAAAIARLIGRLRTMPEVQHIIVSDGGSDDETVAIARNAGAKVLCSARGRGTQLNAGAQHALKSLLQGTSAPDEPRRALWFLHADALPHPLSGRDIINALQSPQIIGGNFRLQFESPLRLARFFEQIARWQRRRGVFYGDSGLWVRVEAWHALGGFQNWPLFEDLDFARRLQALSQAQNMRLKYLHRPLLASARRFEAQPWRTLYQWILLQSLFSLGVAPHHLADLYYRQKSAASSK